MWLIRELTRRTSAEVPAFDELVADGEVLSNAANHVDWSEPDVLLSRCTYCGGDDTDGWVRLRRSGELVVLQPIFDAEAWMAPPSALARTGIAVVPHALLRSFVKKLLPLEARRAPRAGARMTQRDEPSQGRWQRAGRSTVRTGLVALLVVGCGAAPLPRPAAKKQEAAPTWASTVGRVAPQLPAPEGAREISATEGELPARFWVDGSLDDVWSRWRAALERSGFEVTILEEQPSQVVAHVDQGAARGYLHLIATDRAVVHGSLGWVAQPSTTALRGACVPPPQRDVQVMVRSREANPPPDREDPPDQPWSFRTQRALDVDSDGRLDVIVPDVERFDCPHEVEYAIYVMRGACGHLVGRTLGSPQVAGRARPGRLRDLRTERSWAQITDPRRPPGPNNVATHYEVTTPYVARGGAYRAGRPTTRAGTCHHCGIPWCRVVSGN